MPEIANVASSDIYKSAETPKGMSLADMLNLSKSSYELQKLKELYPSMISEQQARAKTAVIGSEVAEAIKTPTISKAQSEAERLAIEAQKVGVNLNMYHGNLTKSILGAYATDPDFINGNKDKMIEKIKLTQDYLSKHGIQDKANLADQMIDLAKTDPSKLLTLFGNMRMSQMTPTEQQNVLGGQQTVQGQDISGNPTISERDPNTGQIVQKPLPVSGTSPINMRIAPTENAKTVENMQTQRTEAQDIASVASNALTNIDTVLKYLPLAATGKGGETIAGLQSVFGNLAGSTAEEKAAAARDIIQKNITDLGLQKNAALGGKYAASLNGAMESLANAGKNPTAIYKAMQQLKPLIEHSKNYSVGLENTINKYGSVQVKRLYDSAMVNAFDPLAINLYDAYKSNNEKDFKELTAGLSESKKVELGQKMAKYNKLINGNLE